jgi:hypothetical protein
METLPLMVKGCQILIGQLTNAQGGNLNRVIRPAVTRDLGFSGLIRRIAPLSRFLRHTRGRGGTNF